jgi:L,D-peptidoglycan transpeptidase YkuD (ErfK/YbiS/YcfS/YnhG family)
MLPVQRIRRMDGWCDAPGDRNYNRPVRHPYPASAERLWRDDALYDMVVVLRHNQRPRLRGRGSAIFMHVARPGYLPTEGCIALERGHLLRVLERLRPGSVVEVLPNRSRP